MNYRYQQDEERRAEVPNSCDRTALNNQTRRCSQAASMFARTDDIENNHHSNCSRAVTVCGRPVTVCGRPVQDNRSHHCSRPSSQSAQQGSRNHQEAEAGGMYAPHSNVYNVRSNATEKSQNDFPEEQFYEPSHLTKRNLAARQAMQRDLPLFSGRAEEWPLFISRYENTTRTCNFSHEENLERLQRCLKGQALEAVRCKLMLPSAVPSIIETLRSNFGRPEILINNILKKMRSEPLPKIEKLESIISFASSVQNLCCTMEASGLLTHMTNPTLLVELTDRLPPQMRLSWASFMRSSAIIDVNLKDLSEWLSDLATSARVVTVPCFDEGNKQEERSNKHRGHVFTHVVNKDGSALSAMKGLTR